MEDRAASAAVVALRCQRARPRGWRCAARPSSTCRTARWPVCRCRPRCAPTARGGGWNVDAKTNAANNKATLQGQLAARADGDRWRAEIDAPALAALRPLVAALAPRAGLDGLDGAATGQAASQRPLARGAHAAARCAAAPCAPARSAPRNSPRNGKPARTATRRCR